jgi:hypothetical protein
MYGKFIWFCRFGNFLGLYFGLVYVNLGFEIGLDVES